MAITVMILVVFGLHPFFNANKYTSQQLKMLSMFCKKSNTYTEEVSLPKALIIQAYRGGLIEK
jgi:hypothetical protein